MTDKGILFYNPISEEFEIKRRFIHDGFENEIKDRPRTHQDTHQDKILEFCKEPRTTKEIMTYLGLKDRRNFYLFKIYETFIR